MGSADLPLSEALKQAAFFLDLGAQIEPAQLGKGPRLNKTIQFRLKRAFPLLPDANVGGLL